MTNATVVSVGRDDSHQFSKPVVEQIILLAGLGIEGDAHCGATTQHRYLVKKDPGRPNLCQVHLIGVELYADLVRARWSIEPGELGENVTTRGLDLMSLPSGSILHLGAEASIEITGKRSPCSQINGLAPGLMKAVFGVNGSGTRESRAGIMGIVLTGGIVRANDDLRVELPQGPFRALVAV
ncbi:MOSC domain-containing protein [Frigoribacterium sp. CG_9.8]|uniref:MOSC domain-containing protein n=1 Tax=Frigoribacterium sp. CG_9.8 TaxID=2787733 RepID=UPI0018CB804F|nr:MOSC domain-containing protein [Frigoribacterium sp. CG_9.8]MBG6107202.1 MOSC domain-containing protein YiiM [Frigoribacterium sp. CG_9.8]